MPFRLAIVVSSNPMNLINAHSLVTLDTRSWTMRIDKVKWITARSCGKKKCDPASQNQQKVAWPSFVLWLEIGDQGQHGYFLDFDIFWKSNPSST